MNVIPKTLSGSAASNLVMKGNAGVLKFTEGRKMLHALQIDTGGSVIAAEDLLITGQ